MDDTQFAAMLTRNCEFDTKHTDASISFVWLEATNCIDPPPPLEIMTSLIGADISNTKYSYLRLPSSLKNLTVTGNWNLKSLPSNLPNLEYLEYSRPLEISSSLKSSLEKNGAVCIQNNFSTKCSKTNKNQTINYQKSIFYDFSPEMLILLVFILFCMLLTIAYFTMRFLRRRKEVKITPINRDGLKKYEQSKFQSLIQVIEDDDVILTRAKTRDIDNSEFRHPSLQYHQDFIIDTNADRLSAMSNISMSSYLSSLFSTSHIKALETAYSRIWSKVQKEFGSDSSSNPSSICPKRPESTVSNYTWERDIFRNSVMSTSSLLSFNPDRSKMKSCLSKVAEVPLTPDSFIRYYEETDHNMLENHDKLSAVCHNLSPDSIINFQSKDDGNRTPLLSRNKKIKSEESNVYYLDEKNHRLFQQFPSGLNLNGYVADALSISDFSKDQEFDENATNISNNRLTFTSNFSN
jgi:hypothetical protein